MSAKDKPEAKSKSQRKLERKAARTPPPGWQDPLAQRQPLVSGGWLLRALLTVLLLAFASAYLTLCLLFYQGQWQVVFHPSRSVTATPASVGLKYDEVRFDYTGTGTPQLAGWWISADTSSSHTARTILLLHDRQGSLSDTVSQLKTLHATGAAVFAFDYRGFGQSADRHPSEERVYEDATAAWTYLTDIRHLDPKSITIYGTGLGATIAAETALRHTRVASLILENPAPPALSLIGADSRTHLIPIRWLFRDRFEIGPKLHDLGIQLNETTAAIVDTGKLSPAVVIVHADSAHSNGPSVLLLLGPNVDNDPQCFSAISEFLSRR